MIKCELATGSTKVGDTVFVIVPKLKRDKLGRLYSAKSEQDLIVEHAIISELRYGWSCVEFDCTWSFAATVPPAVDDVSLGRYIDSLPINDCFETREEAEEALAKRMQATRR